MRLLGKTTYYIVTVIIYTVLIYFTLNKYIEYKTEYIPVVFGNMVCKCVKVKDYYDCTPNNCIYFEIKPNEGSEESREDGEINIKSNVL